MSFTYRQMASGELPSQEGTRRCYVLGELVKVITVASLEKRLEALEAPLPGQEDGGDDADPE
jgi:hypothetical protein